MRRVTITMPDETFDRAKATVDRGAAPSLSAYLSTLADEHTREGELLQIVDALDAEHGAPGAEDVAWARSVVRGGR